jgi:tetratricopeptide (TPR) repeat protein
VNSSVKKLLIPLNNFVEIIQLHNSEAVLIILIIFVLCVSLGMYVLNNVSMPEKLNTILLILVVVAMILFSIIGVSFFILADVAFITQSIPKGFLGFITIVCFIAGTVLQLKGTFKPEIYLHDADDYYDSGLVLYDQGKYDKAIQLYNKAIELDPQSPKIWNSKGLVLHAIGEKNIISLHNKGNRVNILNTILAY